MRVLALPLLAVAVLGSGARAEDWPQFLGPRRDGTSRTKGLLKSWPADGPRLLWRREVGAGFAGPVVAGKQLILFHRVGDREVVEALDAETGKGLWKFDYPTAFADDFGKGNGPRATPGVAGSRVVTYGADGWLHGLDLETGRKLWGRDVVTEYRVPPSYFGVGASPLVVEGRVLVNVGGPKAGIVAFDLESGKELWKATGDGASYSSPVLTGESPPRAVFFTRNGVVILDPRSGEVSFTKRWRARYDASVNAAPPLLLDGGLALFSTSYETGALLLKLAPAGADTVWTSEDALSAHYTNLVAHRGRVYGCDGRQEAGARLRCIDPRPAGGPQVLWSKERFGCSSILLAEDHLILLTESGDLVLAEANPEHYAEKARARVLQESPVRAVPALAEGRLYARDQGQLICLGLVQR